MANFFIPINRIPLLAPTLDNAHPLFAPVVITPDFYLNHEEVVDHDPASGSLYADKINIKNKQIPRILIPIGRTNGRFK